MEEQNNSDDERNAHSEEPSAISGEERIPESEFKKSDGLDAETVENIEKIFKDKFSVLKFIVNGKKFEILSFDELSMSALMEVATSDKKEQISLIRNYAKICLINPKQMEVIDDFSFPEFNKFVKLWIELSSVSNRPDWNQIEEDYYRGEEDD